MRYRPCSRTFWISLAPPRRGRALPAARRRRQFPSSRLDQSQTRLAAIRETIDLIETDLAAMIRDVQRAVRCGARRHARDLRGARRDPRPERAACGAGRPSDRERDAPCGRDGGVRAIVRRDRPPGARGRHADRRCRPGGGGRRQERRWAEGLIGRDRQRREPDLGDRQADQSAGAQRHDRGGARRRCRAAALRWWRTR